MRCNMLQPYARESSRNKSPRYRNHYKGRAPTGVTRIRYVRCRSIQHWIKQRMISLTTTVPRRPLRPHIPSILSSTHGTSESISKAICPKATTLSPRIRSAANEAILGSRLRRAKEAKGIYKSRAYHGVGICQSLPSCTDDFDGARTCPDPPFRQWSVVHRRCRVVVRVPAVTSTCQLGSRAAAQCSLGGNATSCLLQVSDVMHATDRTAAQSRSLFELARPAECWTSLV